MAGLIRLIGQGVISRKTAKEVFSEMWMQGGGAKEIVKARGLAQITDVSEIELIIDDILEKNSLQVKEFRKGKQKVFSFFVGQVMKASKGQASPELVNKILRGKLKG